MLTFGNRFFGQTTDAKMKISSAQSRYFNGYKGPRATNISPSESVDVKETVRKPLTCHLLRDVKISNWEMKLGWRYSPQYDPDTKDLNAIPEEVKPWLRGEEFVWEGTAHLPGFKEEVLAYWAACLTLSRKLVRVFALSLDLAEDYCMIPLAPGHIAGMLTYSKIQLTVEQLIQVQTGLSTTTQLQQLKKRQTTLLVSGAILISSYSLCSGRTWLVDYRF